MRYYKLKTQSVQPYLDYGVIVEEMSSKFVVETSYGCVDAGQALSCMVKPEVDDEVLVCQDQTNRCFILSVLDRTDKEERPVNIVFPAEVNIHLKNGGLSIHSKEDISLTSENKISMVSQDMVIHASDGEVCVERLSFLGKLLRANIEGIKIVGSVIESAFQRVVQKARTSFRYVEEHEDVRTGSTRYLVKETLNMRSKNSVHIAKKQMKMDAEQIHLG